MTMHTIIRDVRKTTPYTVSISTDYENCITIEIQQSESFKTIRAVVPAMELSKAVQTYNDLQYLHKRNIPELESTA